MKDEIKSIEKDIGSNDDDDEKEEKEVKEPAGFCPQEKTKWIEEGVGSEAEVSGMATHGSYSSTAAIPITYSTSP